MNRTNLLLALGLASLSVPAFATHPNEYCRVKLDMAALVKSAGVDASSVRVRFLFAGGMANMTDMNPPGSEVVARPAEGPWIYATEIHSNLYYRTLRAVRVESILFKPEDGTSVWSIQVDRPATDEKKKDGPISCENYAS